jgi:hypothetical protein
MTTTESIGAPVTSCRRRLTLAEGASGLLAKRATIGPNSVQALVELAIM